MMASDVSPPQYSFPKDASSLILIDRSGPQPRVLMGQRNYDMAFMPGYYVFPGGRTDRSDSFLIPQNTLPNNVQVQLSSNIKGRSGAHHAALAQKQYNRTQALALTAIRETFEETGILVGSHSPSKPRYIPDMWKTFFAHNIEPKLSALEFVARAITPPNKIKRYDTRFFCTYTEEIGKVLEFQKGELLHIDWFTFEQAKSQNIPRITRAILSDMEIYLQKDNLDDPKKTFPFYYIEQELVQRIWL
ncbi:MAG: NUDIX hydrolase [Pseudomonadota bacterium]